MDTVFSKAVRIRLAGQTAPARGSGSAASAFFAASSDQEQPKPRTCFPLTSV